MVIPAFPFPLTEWYLFKLHSCYFSSFSIKSVLLVASFLDSYYEIKLLSLSRFSPEAWFDLIWFNLIFSLSQAEHTHSVQAVLQRLLHNHFYVKATIQSPFWASLIQTRSVSIAGLTKTILFNCSVAFFSLICLYDKALRKNHCIYDVFLNCKSACTAIVLVSSKCILLLNKNPHQGTRLHDLCTHSHTDIENEIKRKVYVDSDRRKTCWKLKTTALLQELNKWFVIVHSVTSGYDITHTHKRLIFVQKMLCPRMVVKRNTHWWQSAHLPGIDGVNWKCVKVRVCVCVRERS